MEKKKKRERKILNFFIFSKILIFTYRKKKTVSKHTKIKEFEPF